MSDLFGIETRYDPEKIIDPPKINSQGTEANTQGQALEDAIEREFARRGVFVCRYIKHRNAKHDLFDRRALIKRVPYRSIYRHNAHTEFVYCHGNGLHVRIECKRQEGPGSVDEKMPYLLRNAEEMMPEKHIWIVLEGSGLREGARDWTVEEATRISRRTGKTIRVMKLSEAWSRIKLLVERGIA